MNRYIRPFEPKDQALARQLILEGLGEHFGLIDESMNPDLEDIWATYIAAGHHFLVAEDEGLLVATGGLLIEQRETGRIVRVSVRRDRRGQRFGKTMVDHLVEIGRQQRLQKIVVETNLDWYAAIALYTRCGFRENARDETSIHFALRL